MSSPRIARHDTRKIVKGVTHAEAPDELAVEEPLEIRIDDESIAVTMRTPGDDFELAAGFLRTEGIFTEPSQIGAMRFCGEETNPAYRNIINVTPSPDMRLDLGRLKRNFYATSSCGVCGKAAIENIRTEAKPIVGKFRVKLDVFYRLGTAMRSAQTVFEKTGGLHAAGLFDLHGALIELREDIGRHNATDKVIGRMFLDGKLPLDKHLLMVSGRASFEIMQKALMAGIPIVCAVSAPSSLAVEFARESGMTLVGFLRADQFNVYSGAERIEV
ncbi:MAG TPA: formate dehydrogenase accessory sulfurtransferase FdhD [Planctomycetota bacterium]|nr:formate dehydrogenase accessory sulfurtransferase FdhD [Planctomycetota bacterium]